MRSILFTPALSAFALLIACTQPAQCNPLPGAEEGVLEERACSNPCGYYSQLCCTSSQTCSTNSLGQAVCVDGTGSPAPTAGSWQYYTTTYTRTDLTTVTSVYSSYITAAPTSGASTCAASLGETTCGTSCCSAAQICDNGVCIAAASSSDAGLPGATATATPPLRPTSSGISTVTQTNAPTTTLPFVAPVATNGTTVIAQASSGGGGLSGGAIAGIVIGAIAGVFFLILLCACLCIRGAIDGILALLGLRSRKRKDTTYVEERVSHHSHGEPERRTWFGTRPSRPARASEKKKSGLGFWAWLALIVGAIALCLGLRRSAREEKSEHGDGPGSSYYYYSDYYTSASE
jgi:hypothetical protein